MEEKLVSIKTKYFPHSKNKIIPVINNYILSKGSKNICFVFVLQTKIVEKQIVRNKRKMCKNCPESFEKTGKKCLGISPSFIKKPIVRFYKRSFIQKFIDSMVFLKCKR